MERQKDQRKGELVIKDQQEPLDNRNRLIGYIEGTNLLLASVNDEIIALTLSEAKDLFRGAKDGKR